MSSLLTVNCCNGPYSLMVMPSAFSAMLLNTVFRINHVHTVLRIVWAPLFLAFALVAFALARVDNAFTDAQFGRDFFHRQTLAF